MTFQVTPVNRDVFIQGATGSIPGFSGTEKHPHLKRVLPYVFRRDLLVEMAGLWIREMTRPETADRRGVWLSGEMAAGKTSLVTQFFARLGVPVIDMTADEDFSVGDATISQTLTPAYRTLPDGTKEPYGVTTRWVDGPIATALRQGIPLVINELNLASPGRLTGLNGIVENGTYVVPDTGELITAQRGFMLFVCANANGGADESGNYAAVQQMNQSLVSRFHHIEVQYLNEAEEADAVQCALQWRTQGMAADARSVFDLAVQRLCKIAATIRENYTKGRATGTAAFPFPIATRQVIAAAEALLMFPAKEPELQALQGAYIRTLPAQLREAAELLVRTVV